MKPERSKSSLKRRMTLTILVLLPVMLSPGQAPAAKKSAQPIPHAANAVLFKAYQLMQKQDFSSAVSVLESFQARRPKGLNRGDRDPEGHFHYLVDFNLGNAYLHLNRQDRAITHFKLALSGRSDFSPAWMNLAKAYYEAGSFSPAAESFIRAYQTAKQKQPDPLYFAAASFVSDKKYDRALEVLSKLFTDHKNAVEVQWREQLVHVYLALERPQDALAQIETLAETTKGEKQKQWQETLLHQFLTMNRDEKALGYAERLTQIYPTDPKYWKALVHLHLGKNRHKQALVSLTVYSYLAQLSEEENRLLADLSSSLGIPVQASRYYEKALVQKKSKTTFDRLVRSYLSLGRAEMALSAVERALNRFDDVDLLMLKGDILYDLGKYRPALRAFEKAARQKPDYGRAWLMMGYAAWKLDDYALAKTALNAALSFESQQEAAGNLLKQLAHLENRE